MPRSFSLREGAQLPSKGIDSYMFPSKRKSIKNWFAPEKVKDVGKAISKWFIYNAIPFHAADSGPYYQAMINTIADVGPGVQGPSGRQIGGVFLEEEVEDITAYLNTLKSKWPKYGCTIMCDGWSTRNKHPIINFMIYCDRNMIFHSSVDCTNQRKTADFILSLLNKVIDEIGEENIVHVVTDSESANKAAGQKLMIERPHMFWSPCAAHCIDLMLEDIGKMTKVKRCIDKAKQITSFIYNSDKVVNLMKIYTNDRELLRPGITRFATEFISLESLVRYSQDLKRLCTSIEWQEYNNTSKRRKDAEKITAIILDAKFWKSARGICAAMEPLVKVLKLVDQDNKPTLSIIYEAMDRAKLCIQQSVKDWKLYWDVIDERWYNQLHQHLHAAGKMRLYLHKINSLLWLLSYILKILCVLAYFLNPMLQYSGTCVYTDEVRRGLKTVIKRLEPDLNAQASMINEIKLFTEQIGEFGSPLAKMAVKKSLPAEWWNEYGEEAPHLRKIAIKVLSQTCSSSGCERNWSTWSLIHTKLRNRLAMKKLHKLVYVHYNMRLRVRNLMHKSGDDDYYSPIDLDHIFSDDDILNEWTRDNEPSVLQDDDLEWLDQGHEISNAQERNKTLAGQSYSKNKNNEGSSRLSKSKGIILSESDETEDDDKSDDSNDSGDGNNRESDKNQERQDDQHDTGMSWAQGKENYYATQDTDHGYRPGIEEQRRFLASLSSAGDDEYFSGSSHSYMAVEEHIKNLGLGGHHQFKFEGYSNSPRNRYRNPQSPAATGIRHDDHRYTSSSEASNSLGYQEFGGYHRRDETLLNPHSLHHVHSVSNPLFNEYPRGQFNTGLYQQPYGGDQFSQLNPDEEYTDDFVPPRHSSWDIGKQSKSIDVR
ncbi:uncharacterized protein [Primulina eburnea]